MNGCDQIFQKGVPIYGDKVNYVQATLTLFLIGGTTTCIGLNNPMIHLIHVVYCFFSWWSYFFEKMQLLLLWHYQRKEKKGPEFELRSFAPHHWTRKQNKKKQMGKKKSTWLSRIVFQILELSSSSPSSFIPNSTKRKKWE